MATIKGSRASTESLSQGLDRATFNVYPHADRHLVTPLHRKEEDSDASVSVSEDDDARPDLNVTSLNNLRRFSKKVRRKTDKILHPRHKKQKSADSWTVPTLAPPPSQAADGDRMYNAVPEQKGPDFKEVVKNPISTVQSVLHGATGAKFAEALDNQVIAHGAEVRIVRAYDDVKSAETDDAKTSALEALESLKKERQDAYVRWTLDRHVLKVRQVPPRTTTRPKREDYEPQGEDGKAAMQWLDYGHNVRHALDVFTLSILRDIHCVAVTCLTRTVILNVALASPLLRGTLWRPIH